MPAWWMGWSCGMSTKLRNYSMNTVLYKIIMDVVDGTTPLVLHYSNTSYTVLYYLIYDLRRMTDTLHWHGLTRLLVSFPTTKNKKQCLDCTECTRTKAPTHAVLQEMSKARWSWLLLQSVLSCSKQEGAQIQAGIHWNEAVYQMQTNQITRGVSQALSIPRWTWLPLQSVLYWSKQEAAQNKTQAGLQCNETVYQMQTNQSTLGV